MKRITNFFGGPDLKDQQHDSAPPTPPLAPDLMREDLPSPVPRNLRPSSQSLSSYKGRHSSLAPGNSPYLQSGMASSTPILAPPVRLGRRLSRPGTSSGGSRPSTPSFSLSGANSVMNLGLGSGFLPIFKKKTHERFGKGTAQHMAWILAPDSGTNMEPYDIQPLVRGEPVCMEFHEFL